MLDILLLTNFDITRIVMFALGAIIIGFSVWLLIILIGNIRAQKKYNSATLPELEVEEYYEDDEGENSSYAFALDEEYEGGESDRDELLLESQQIIANQESYTVSSSTENGYEEVTANPPIYGASFGTAVKRFFTGYVRFSGRASRSEFWWVELFLFLVFTAFSITTFILMPSSSEIATVLDYSGTTDATTTVISTMPQSVVIVSVIASLFYLAIIIPHLAITWRRLHDTNLSGAFFFTSFIPFVGGLVLLILLVRGSNPAGERFDKIDYVPVSYEEETFEEEELSETFEEEEQVEVSAPNSLPGLPNLPDLSFGEEEQSNVEQNNETTGNGNTPSSLESEPTHYYRENPFPSRLNRRKDGGIIKP